MTKMQNYQRAQSYGSYAGFLANVILCGHRNPARKLAGLVRLLEHGIVVSTAPFSMDTLLVGGVVTPWESLETIAK
jgi:hypothetical protein